MKRNNKLTRFAESDLMTDSRDNVQENVVSTDKIVKNTIKTRDFSSLAGTSSLSLQDFFKRPVLIDSFSFNETNDVFRTVDVYSAWSQDPTVRAKLKTYAYFRGDLTLRIIVTSNAFQYGSLLFSNQPYPDINLPLNFFLDSGQASNADGNFKRAFNCYLYQSPETVLVKYGGDSTYEMDIPFLAPKPVVKLYNAGVSAINNATEFEELAPLSRLFISEFNPLLNNSSEFDQTVSVEIYAYCKNAQLSVATSTDFDITAETDLKSENPVSEGDKIRNVVNNNKILKAVSDKLSSFHQEGEYVENGAVSNIATAVSGITGKLSDVPFVGDFARATSLATGKLANLARSFGFSKPIVLDKIQFRKNVPFTSSNSSGVDTSYKLSTDPKQELALMHVSGEEGLDQMSISYLASRESYMGTRRWQTALVPRQDTIVTIPIHPQTNVLANTVDMHPVTHLSYISNFFQRWRGTITIKVEVLAPRFARGKLAIIYEPNNNIIDDVADTQPNQQMIYYMDIGEERTKEIDCGFIFDRPFAKCGNVFDVLHPPELILTGNDEFCSGSLIVRPFTRVSGVDPLAGAYINFYISSRDIEYAMPNQLKRSDSPYFSLNSNLVGTGQLVNDPPLAVAQSDLQFDENRNRSGEFEKISSSVNINRAPPLNPDAFLSNFGERILSFRQLFKKSFLCEIRSFGTSTTILNCESVYRTWFNLYPELGRNSTSTVGVSPLFNISPREHSFNYFTKMFLFMRGSMRYKIIIDNVGADFPSYATTTLNLTNNRDLRIFTDDISSVDIIGNSLHHRNTNEGIEIEIPYYSSNFYDPVVAGLPGLAPTETFDIQSIGAILEFPAKTTKCNVYTYASIGEDFQLLRFQGAPPYGNTDVNVDGEINFSDFGASPHV